MLQTPAFTTCRTLAPEDVCGDDDVTQVASYCWDSELQKTEDPIRDSSTPCESGIPACVRSICLPYIFVKRPNGKIQTWDFRQCRIARMSVAHAEIVWKSPEPKRKRKKTKNGGRRNNRK